MATETPMNGKQQARDAKNSAINAFKSNDSKTPGEMLEHLTDFKELILKDVDMVEEKVRDFGNTALTFVKKNPFIVAIAVAGLGLAIRGFAGSRKDRSTLN